MRIGVDLGGSKIEAIVLSRTGQERARRRITAPHGDYDTTVRAVRDLVTEVRAQAGGGDATIGIGTPGSLSPTTGLLRNANSVWLNGRPLKADLSAALGQPVKLANDADCFAMSEATDGAGKGASSVFGVIIGTGVGGGVVVGGTLLAGANGIAGEWGHNPLADSAPPRTCWCGRVGCIETWLSGPALSADYALSASPAPTVEIAERAGAGEPAAIAAFDRYVERLGRALATVVNVLDP